MKVHEFERIVSKLGMDTRNSYDRLAWLVHNGVTVVKTRRSHGSSKPLPGDKIRQQLKLNESQLSGLISCDVTKQDYIQILTQKGVIAATPAAAQPSYGSATKPIPSKPVTKKHR